MTLTKRNNFYCTSGTSSNKRRSNGKKKLYRKDSSKRVSCSGRPMHSRIKFLKPFTCGLLSWRWLRSSRDAGMKESSGWLSCGDPTIRGSYRASGSLSKSNDSVWWRKPRTRSRKDWSWCEEQGMHSLFRSGWWLKIRGCTGRPSLYYSDFCRQNVRSITIAWRSASSTDTWKRSNAGLNLS